MSGPPELESAGPPASGTAQPSGTVTFLFTDIEGSTRLLDDLRGDYATVLEDQRDLLRAQFSEWGGFEVDTQGDSFFVAFPRASDAVNCALAAQRALAGHAWPRGSRVRVRMGLHTGEPEQARSGYVGMDVHRAARIAAAAHGGQVVLSGVTHDLLDAELPVGTRIVDLGMHRLKDVRSQMHLFQVVGPGAESDFPALRTLDTDEAPPVPGEAPYKGLRYFDEADADLFFGRERLTEKLVERVRAEPFLAIVGASGSGKSSITRAGLLPALPTRRGRRWRLHVMTPTERPLEALALTLTNEVESVTAAATLLDDLRGDPRSLYLAALRLSGAGRRTPADRVLLVVDQFEELFTLCRDQAQRDAFVANLLAASSPSDTPVRIVITLRADFYAHLAGYGELRDLVAARQVYIGPMSTDELRQAIEAPAAAGGWELAPGLVDLILHDAGTEPGALPLLSHALLETWHRRRGTAMTLKAYTESGGVRGAIARTADRVFHVELSAEQQAIARDIFLRLTELGEGTQDTRRRVALRELLPDAPDEAEAVEHVIRRLADARLITTAESTAEVAHEALIREWPTLRDWLGEDREGLRTHRHLTEAAEEWELLERDPGALYRGVRLSQSTDWARDHPGALNSQERAFLEASQALALHEAGEREEQRRRELEAAEQLASAERRRAEEQARAARGLRRRAVFLSGALAVSAVLAVVAIIFGQQALQSEARAEANAGRAQEQAELAEENAAQAEANFANAESQRLAAEANNIIQLTESSELAALLAIRGMQAQYTPQADAALQRASRTQFSDRIFSTQIPPGFMSAAVSPDGGLLVAGGRDGTTYLWDTNSGELLSELPGNNVVVGEVRFSPDGQSVALLSDVLRMWDVANDRQLWSVEVAVEGDARYMAFVTSGDSVVLSNDDGVYTVDASSGAMTRTLETEAAGGALLAPDDRTIFIPSGSDGELFDLTTGDRLGGIEGHTDGIQNAAFSRDGRLLATTSRDKTARIWDVASGRNLQTLTGHTEILFDVAFSPDGATLLTGSLDTTARLWDVETGEQRRRYNGHTAATYGVSFTPDGRYAITVSRDQTIRFWDVTVPEERDTLAGPVSFMYALDFSPDGKLLFAGNADGTSQIWDLETQTVKHVLFTDRRVDAAAFSPDGRQLLISPDGGPNELWDVADGTLIGQLADSEGGAPSASFSSDGTLMAANVDLEHVGLWDAEATRLLHSFEAMPFVSGMVSPDGSVVVTHLDEIVPDNVVVWDARTGEKLRSLEHPGGVLGASVSPDSSTILATGRDNVARTWDVASGTLVREFEGHTQIMWRNAWSPDGSYIFTTSQDKSARMWDAETGEQLRYFPGHGISAVADIAVSPDGSTVAIGSYDGFVQLATTDVEALVDSVCSRLLRDLTDSERTVYGITDDRPTCPGSEE